MAAAVAMEAATPANPERDKYVRAAFQRCSSVMGSCVKLTGESDGLALQILNRVLIEEAIKIRWAILSESNAASLNSEGVNQLRKLMRINIGEGLAKFRDKVTGADLTEETVRAGKILGASQKSKPIEVMANEADLRHIYTIFYRFGSLSTHGNSSDSPAWEKMGDVPVNFGAIGAFGRMIGHIGIFWIRHRHNPDNESLRDILGLNKRPSNDPGTTAAEAPGRS